MWKIIKEMPISNYATLKFLFRHFKMIEKYQSENLMNSGKKLNNLFSKISLSRNLIKGLGVVQK